MSLYKDRPAIETTNFDGLNSVASLYIDSTIHLFFDSWVALVQPLVLCAVFAGLQQAGIFNKFLGGDKLSLVDTRDVNNKLNQLEDAVTVSNNNLQEFDERLKLLTDIIDAIKVDVEQISSEQPQQLVGGNKEFSRRDLLVHIAIIGLTVLQLVTVILVFVLWIKLSKLRANVPTSDTTELDTKCEEKQKNNNTDTETCT